MDREQYRQQVAKVARTLLDEVGLENVQVVVHDGDPNEGDFDGVTLELRRPSSDAEKYRIPERIQYEGHIVLTQFVRSAMKWFVEKT